MKALITKTLELDEWVAMSKKYRKGATRNMVSRANREFRGAEGGKKAAIWGENT